MIGRLEVGLVIAASASLGAFVSWNLRPAPAAEVRPAPPAISSSANARVDELSQRLALLEARASGPVASAAPPSSGRRPTRGPVGGSTSAPSVDEVMASRAQSFSTESRGADAAVRERTWRDLVQAHGGGLMLRDVQCRERTCRLVMRPIDEQAPAVELLPPLMTRLGADFAGRIDSLTSPSAPNEIQIYLSDPS
jgi:hypothetical protein